MKVTLDTVEAALAYIEKLKKADDQDTAYDAVELSFEGALAQVRIIVNGKNYHGTVPGDLARGIWEYQSALYKAAAFGLYGIADTRKLTTEQRTRLELVFKVSEGSSDLQADPKDFLDCIKHIFDGMTSSQKLIGIVLLALILTGGYTYMHASDNEKAVLLEQEKTKQGETIRDTALGMAKINQAAEKLSEANETGLIALAKSACDAESIKLGNSKIEAATIRSINQKSERTKPTAELIDGPFMVYEMNGKDSSKTVGTLCDKMGREFTVTLDHEEFKNEDLQKFWNAAAKRQSINLDVTLTVAADGSIRKAQVITIN